MDCCTKKRLFMVMTSACACAAFGLLAISVATDYWLYTSDLQPNKGNGTKGTYKHHWSGLWRFCTINEVGKKSTSKQVDMGQSLQGHGPTGGLKCQYIKYFTIDDEREGLPRTEAILLTMRRSTWFPLASLFILTIGIIICFVGQCNTRRKHLTFVCGILFVLAGLCTLVGIILYIGSITEEVGNKGAQNPMEDPKFKYEYGSSFMMAVCSFGLTELAGVFSVYLYITRYKHSQRKKMQQMLKVETNDKGNRWRHRRTPTQNRDRSHSRERSRDASMSRSESYYTYTPISDTTSHELSNYTFPREASRNTISTTVDTHVPRDHLPMPPPPPDPILRRTTPV